MQQKDKEAAKEWSFSRRAFIGTVSMAGAALAACSGAERGAETAAGTGWPRGTRIEPGPATAPDGRPLKAGLVGCGGRGTGAAVDFLNAGPNLQIAALADVFQDRIEECRAQLRAVKGAEIPDSQVFVGFDAFQKVIDSGVDIVILATPPHFRPQHFEAAVQARRHVFMEKPVAVDPVGARAIMQTAEKADAFGLSVATGTQRRHEKRYIETYNQIVDGAIGDIVSARCYWNQSQLWFRERRRAWSDMEFMIRDWVNWQWLSGDHIVEQHVHNLDVIHWFTNSRAVKAVGMGGRMRRVTGDQYDFFDVDFEMENGIHVHSMCRQIDGCANNISEFVVGTLGSSNCRDTIFDLTGKVVWKYGADLEKDPRVAEEPSSEPPPEDNSPYVQEHIDLVASIRAGKPFNEAVNTATSTLAAIMGRISAYTGKEVAWDELMQSDLRLGPTQYAMGPVVMPVKIPVPGTDSREQQLTSA